MLARAARIAVTAACIVACVLLVWNWTYSYSYCNIWTYGPPRPPLIVAISYNGRLHLFYPQPPPKTRRPRIRTISIPETECSLIHGKFVSTRAVFRLGSRIEASYGLLLSMVGLLAVAVWAPWSWRFSLRSFAIAVTTLAVALGALLTSIVKP